MLHISPQSAPPAVLTPPAPDCGYLSRLLMKSANGDQDAFSTLYDETSSVVYALVARVVGSLPAAEELTQAVYVQIWTDSHTYCPERTGALTWILSVASSSATSARRQLDRDSAVLTSACPAGPAAG